MRDPVFTALFVILLGAMAVETVVYLAAPLLYSLAARLRLGDPIRLPLDRAAREALGAVSDGGVGYRHSAGARIDVGLLPLPDKLETTDLVLHFAPRRGLAVARLPYRIGNRYLGMVRVDISEAGGAIQLSPRFVVFGWPSLLVVAPFAPLALLAMGRPGEDAGRVLVFGIVLVVINGVVGIVLARGRLRSGVEQIRSHVAGAIASASHQGPGPR